MIKNSNVIWSANTITNAEYMGTLNSIKFGWNTKNKWNMHSKTGIKYPTNVRMDLTLINPNLTKFKK